MRVAVLLGIVSVLPLSMATADDSLPLGRLRAAGEVSRDSLRTVTSIAITNDGRFLYASAWAVAGTNVYSRDLESGQLTHLQEIVDDDSSNGATALRLSPDNKYGVAASHRGKKVVLYRIQKDGTIEVADEITTDDDGVTGLDFPIDATFSTDSRFVHVSNANDAHSITTFEVTADGTLQFVEANRGIDDCFDDVRAVVAHPDGETLAAVSSNAGCLVILERDSETGVLEVQELVTDDNGEVNGLSGAMAAMFSPNGKSLYVSSGRFLGDNAIGAYEVNEGGRLQLIHEFINDEDGGLVGFRGGNEITVSPDGKNVYAVATVSSSLACFDRDVETGELTFVETINDQDERLSGGAGIGISPDGRFVYVAAENSGKISIWERGHK